MGTEFVLQVKCSIFWPNRGLWVYLDTYVPDFQKVPPSTFYILVLFSQKRPIMEAFCVKKTTQIMKIMENLNKNTFMI